MTKKEVKILIPIPKEIISKFIIHSANEVCKMNSLDLPFIKSSSVTVITNNSEDGEKFIQQFNLFSNQNFSEFLEKETKKDRSEFNRNLIMNTIENTNGIVTINWKDK